jgi:mannose-6-phosphate isomerase-like protein (cupin superfamily)
MSGYMVAHLEEIDEVDDGHCHWRPVRHHLGIMAFGVNAWIARDAGDRIIYEHNQSFESNEELHLVLRGHAVFELDGERLDAPTGTLVLVRPGTERWRSGPHSGFSTSPVSTPRWPTAAAR